MIWVRSFLDLTKFGQGLGKIWARVVTLTVRNCTRIDIGLRSGRVWDVKFIKSILAVVKKIKRFSDKKIIFSINILFEKWRTVSFIKFEIQDVIDISNSIAIFSNNRLSKFLLLIRQEVSSYMIQKGSMKYWMNFHKYRKFKLNYQRISFKNTLNQKRIDISVI